MFVLTKLARFAIVAVAAAGIVVPTTPATAAKTICVGLVVDARALGGQVSADCTTVRDGSTGYDVLRAAGHTVGFRHDGLICTIDQRPADGCAATDASHFWAYFHREPHSSSWNYSNEGATTYKPENGDTEGWVWRNADSATPQNVPYSTICPQSASPAPTGAVSTTKQTRTPVAVSSSSPSSAIRAPSTSTSSKARSVAHGVHHRPAASTSTAPPTTSTTPTPTSNAARPLADPVIDRDTGSSGAPWGLIVGAIAVAAFGGVAAWRWRRREVD